MIPKSVEFQRLVNLGDFNNVRLRGFFELEGGETFAQGAIEAARQVREQLEAIVAIEKAQEEAERKAREPWRVTPDMVADKPTLREKALRAAQLVAEHREIDIATEAHDRALEAFGVDVAFTTRLDGVAVAEVDGVGLTYQHREFTLVVAAHPPCKISYIRTLEDLAIKWAQLEAWPGGPAVGNRNAGVTQVQQARAVASVGLDPGYPDGADDEDEDAGYDDQNLF